MRKRAVPENGVSFVDGAGQPYATFGKNDSGQGIQGMTSEYELMRGDIVDVFYRTSLGLNVDDEKEEKKEIDGSDGNGYPIRYEFGVTVTNLTKTQSGDGKSGTEGVEATFSDGRTVRYDLVVGADGQASRTRRFVLGGRAASDACFRPLGLYTALFLVPRRAGVDGGWMTVHAMTGRRAVITRAADEAAPTQVYMAVQTTRKVDGFGIASAMGATNTNTNANKNGSEGGRVLTQREAFVRAFADHKGWRVPELVEALRNDTSDDDFYATEIGQVHCPALVAGRVALLGDAGYCPSPITGKGTTLSLVGAYILAGELARHGPDDVGGALDAYERAVRPFVDESQKILPGLPAAIYADSAWGLWLLTSILWVVSKLGIVDLLTRIVPESASGIKLPEYPELNLED